jgi:CheY-like chemotaxis protein
MRPVAVGGGAEALAEASRACADRAPYRVALVDVGVLEADGWELLERLQRGPDPRTCEIVALLPAGRSDGFARCRPSGVTHCLTKPVRQSELIRTAAQALGAPSDPQRAKAADQLTDACGQLRILLAEDGPVNQEVAIGFLEMCGHRVTVASNGKEALTALERDPFDVVLMDLEMPEMDGLEATAAIREKEKTAGGHLPIIAMTAHALPKFRERCRSAGMDGYITKPIQANELFEALKAATARGHDAQSQTRQPAPTAETR